MSNRKSGFNFFWKSGRKKNQHKGCSAVTINKAYSSHQNYQPWLVANSRTHSGFVLSNSTSESSELMPSTRRAVNSAIPAPLITQVAQTENLNGNAPTQPVDREIEHQEHNSTTQPLEIGLEHHETNSSTQPGYAPFQRDYPHLQPDYPPLQPPFQHDYPLFQPDYAPTQPREIELEHHEDNSSIQSVEIELEHHEDNSSIQSVEIELQHHEDFSSIKPVEIEQENHKNYLSTQPAETELEHHEHKSSTQPIEIEMELHEQISSIQPREIELEHHEDNSSIQPVVIYIERPENNLSIQEVHIEREPDEHNTATLLASQSFPQNKTNLVDLEPCSLKSFSCDDLPNIPWNNTSVRYNCVSHLQDVDSIERLDDSSDEIEGKFSYCDLPTVPFDSETKNASTLYKTQEKKTKQKKKDNKKDRKVDCLYYAISCWECTIS